MIVQPVFQDGSVCTGSYLSIFTMKHLQNQDLYVILVTTDNNCSVSLLLIANIFPVNTVKIVKRQHFNIACLKFLLMFSKLPAHTFIPFK